MFDRSSKEGRNLEVSLGLFVGYCIGGLVNAWAFGQTYSEAFSDEKLILGVASIGLSWLLIFRRRVKPVEE